MPCVTGATPPSGMNMLGQSRLRARLMYTQISTKGHLVDRVLPSLQTAFLLTGTHTFMIITHPFIHEYIHTCTMLHAVHCTALRYTASHCIITEHYLCTTLLNTYTHLHINNYTHAQVCMSIYIYIFLHVRV